MSGAGSGRKAVGRGRCDHPLQRAVVAVGAGGRMPASKERWARVRWRVHGSGSFHSPSRRGLLFSDPLPVKPVALALQADDLSA